jgi:hypothetical protein
MAAAAQDSGGSLIARARKTAEARIPPIPPAIESKRLSQNENGKAFRGLAKRGEDLRPVNQGF